MFGSPGVRWGYLIAAMSVLVGLRPGAAHAAEPPPATGEIEIPSDSDPAPPKPRAPTPGPSDEAPKAATPGPATSTDVTPGEGKSPFADDLQKARALAPMPGLRAKIEPKKEPEPERPSRVLIMGSGRWATLPKFAFGIVFDHEPAYDAPSIALGVELGPDAGNVWGFELNWTPLVPKYGNWLEKGKTPDSATYAESTLNMISLDAAYRRHFAVTKDFGIFLGAGLGIGFLAGNVETWDVLPTCVEPVAKCAHWPRATRRKADLPTRVVPILHILAGMQYKVTDDIVIRIQGGFRDVFYLGAGVGTFF